MKREARDYETETFKSLSLSLELYGHRDTVRFCFFSV